MFYLPTKHPFLTLFWFSSINSMMALSMKDIHVAAEFEM